VKVKENLKIVVPQSILNVKEYECTVVSNRNVATFIKEFKVQLPAGEHMDFVPGSYAQIKIPKFDIKYADFDKELIGEEYLPSWEKFKMFDLRCVNTEPTIRAYSMANYPAEGDVFMLTVRIATPPFKPDRSGFMNVNPGIASSYIFSLKPGDKVIMSGPYGEFHVKEHDTDGAGPSTGSGTANSQLSTLNSKLPEMIWVGGGAGMAPLRAQIMHLTRTLNVRDREMHYFYGARALNEVFYLQDFLQLEKDFPNFHFHLALDRTDPAADAQGVKYTAGFVHNVMYDTYLKDHKAPEDIEYYMCGPGPMSAAVVNMLDNLGVAPENILYDDFGGGAPKK
jgi:Na+-transporting NADH:ubiquinone oxidoreductase subunit F